MHHLSFPARSAMRPERATGRGTIRLRVPDFPDQPPPSFPGFSHNSHRVCTT